MKYLLIALSLVESLGAQSSSLPFSEFFDSATPTNQWTVGAAVPGAIAAFGTGTSADSIRWWSGAEVPGMHVLTDSGAGGGRAFASWPINNADFHFRADIYPTAIRSKNGLAGALIALTTGIPGSMTSRDSSIAMGILNGGIYAGLRTGEITNLSGPILSDMYNFTQAGIQTAAGTYYAPFTGGMPVSTSEAAVSQTATATDSLINLAVTLNSAPGPGNSITVTLRVAAMDQVFNCTISNSATSCADKAHYPSFNQGDLLDWKVTTRGVISGTRNLTITAGSKPLAGLVQNAPWPASADSAPVPYWRWTFEAIRDTSSNITFNVYTDQYKSGLSPYYTQTLVIPVNHQADNYEYVSIVTSNGTAASPYQANAQITNIVGYAGVTAGPPFTVTGITPSGGSTTFQSGNEITITGTGFAASTYSVRIGQASTLQTVTATCISPTTLIATLPPEPNGSIYMLHVSGNGMDAEYYPGIQYNVPKLAAIDPFEVPATPANDADATVTFTGTGFDPNSTVTIGGIPATVTYVSPTQLTVIVPPGKSGDARVVVTSGTGDNLITVYDSKSPDTYPITGKVNFGYANHPYMQFTAGPSAITQLSDIQTKWLDPNFASYVADINRSLTGGNGTGIAGAPDLWEYGYHYILSGTPASLVTYKYLLASDSTGVGLPNGELNRIAFGKGGYPALLGSNVQHIAEFYDAFFPNMTPSERSAYLTYLTSAVSYYEYVRKNDSNAFGLGTSWPNRVAIAQAGGGQAALAMINSLQSFHGYTAAAPYISATGLAEATNAAAQLKGWANYSWMPDGGYVEGSQYAAYGGAAYLQFAHAMQNMAALGMLTDDQGILNTNYRYYANWVASLWDGTQWATFNDTEPESVCGVLLVDAGVRYNNPGLLYLSDMLKYNTVNDVGIYGFHTTDAGGTYYYGAPYEIMWRDPASFSTTAFLGWPAVQVNASVQQASLRSDTTFTTPFYIGIKGTSNHEVGSNQHHQQGDTGTFVVQYKGEEFLLDPGYYRPGANSHNVPTIDGKSQGITAASVSAFDPTATVNTANFRSVAIDVRPAYAAVQSNISQFRRTFLMYANGGAAIGFVLDDIALSSGTGAIVSYLQAGKAPVLTGTAGFMLAGATNNLAVSFDGPPVTSLTNAPGNLCAYSSTPSWLYCGLSGGVPFGSGTVDTYSPGTTYGAQRSVNYESLVYVSQVANNLGVTPGTDGTRWKSLGGASINYNTIEVGYTNVTATPMITILTPSASDGSGALTAAVDRSTPGVINIAISDGSAVQFTQQAGIWKLSSTTPNQVIAP